MTDKEKANNIATYNLNRCFGNKQIYGATCALEMAEWKDDKFYTILACVKYSLNIQGFDGEQFVEDMKKQWEDD